jgi:benzoyl-CoA reductase/2-hydroxyglutaryl-CoA dehydratase subunit BcrC/BadD/HgdB
MESSRIILTKIFTDYYLSAAQAKNQGRPVAYLTAFVPVEILRAMDITCVYPESYAVVCAASGKAPEMIEASGMANFADDLCSYSLLSFGTDGFARLPYGGIPEPDLLIATNNQCGTTLLWFRLLAQKKKIPLFILDYPSSGDQPDQAEYILRQYEDLIAFLSEHTAQTLDAEKLSDQIASARQASGLWAKLHTLNQSTPPAIDASRLVDALFPIVAAKGSANVCRFYEAMMRESSQANPPQTADGPGKPSRLLWHGYPMWFLPKRFPPLFDDRFQIVLNDYTLWWALDYPQANDLEALVSPYRNTWLNWPLERRIQHTERLIADYSIDGVILHANRSCRRALAHLLPLREHLSQQGIPSVIIESDMVNRDYYPPEQIKLKIESFRERLSVG